MLFCRCGKLLSALININDMTGNLSFRLNLTKNTLESCVTSLTTANADLVIKGFYCDRCESKISVDDVYLECSYTGKRSKRSNFSLIKIKTGNKITSSSFVIKEYIKRYTDSIKNSFDEGTVIEFIIEDNIKITPSIVRQS